MKLFKKGTQIGKWSTLFRIVLFVLSAQLFGALVAAVLLAITFVPFKKLVNK